MPYAISVLERHRLFDPVIYPAIVTLMEEMDKEVDEEFHRFHGVSCDTILPKAEEPSVNVFKYAFNNLLVAYDTFSGEIVGFLAFNHNDTPWSTINIDKLFVKKNHRRKGIAKALYKHIADNKDNTCQTIITLNVGVYNKSAIEFYKSLGFSPLAQKMFTITNK